MKILLIGDYSNVHSTLSEGLKTLGHDCVVASNGDFWKNYPRDIDLSREYGIKGNAAFLWKLMKALPKMRGFDIVQLINPIFLELKAERIIPIYNYLRKHNKKVILGAYGMDYYWVQVNSEIKPLRYSDFNFGEKVRTDEEALIYQREYIGTPKGETCQYIAKDCDYIVAGLQEYQATYNAVEGLREKLAFIPFPIKMPETTVLDNDAQHPLRIFVGISRNRSAYKGTDVMLAAAQKVKEQYPDRVELRVVEGVPFDEYQQIMNSSDCILDQLYSYTPAMNALLAMSKGIINVGGGEPENYDILNEKELRPIVNVQPSFESCYHELEQLVLHPERIPLLKQQSVEYIRKHHDYIKVAREYEMLYNKILGVVNR